MWFLSVFPLRDCVFLWGQVAEPSFYAFPLFTPNKARRSLLIEISRSFIKQFRAVLRRSAWQHARRGGLQPAVEFNAGSDGVTIRCQHDGIAVSYQSPEPQHRESLRVPANALEDFEGRGQARMSVESAGKDTVLARWEDDGVPHEKTYDASAVAKTPDFPTLPARFTDNDHTILKALHDAM